MGSVHDSCQGGSLVFSNRIQLGRSIAVCLIALGICVTSLADDTATMARPGSLSQERLNSAAQNSTDFFVTHGNYAQTRYHPADRINTQTVKDLKFAWTFQVDLTESIQGAPIVYDGVMYLTTSFNHLFAWPQCTASTRRICRCERRRGTSNRTKGRCLQGLPPNRHVAKHLGDSKYLGPERGLYLHPAARLQKRRA